MKLYTRALLSATVLCILSTLLSESAHAQTKFSPRYNIAYDAQGFDEVSDRYIDKRAAKIERKFGAGAAADFRFQMDRMRHFGDWVDVQYEDRRRAWARCYDVSRADIHRMTVIVEDGTWTRPDYPELHYIWGAMDYRTNTIRVTAWAFVPNWGTVNAVDTLRYEMGNFFQVMLMGEPFYLQKEIGVNDPCR